MGVIPPKNGGTYTITTTEITTETTTTTTEAAVVDFKNRFPKSIRSRIPKIYQDHKDVLVNIDTYLKTHGEPYVTAELDYATRNSTKDGGFPAFLKRSLENGWGTEDRKLQQSLQKAQLDRERRQKERALEAQRAEQEHLADIEKQGQQIDRKVQETLEGIPPSELNRIQTEAREQAEQKISNLKGQKSQMLAAAREKLASLSDQERKTLFEVAKEAVRTSIGNLLGENHPGFQRAVDNQVLKEIQERYPLQAPLADRWKKRVETEANRILRAMIIRKYGLLKYQTTEDAT